MIHATNSERILVRHSKRIGIAAWYLLAVVLPAVPAPLERAGVQHVLSKTVFKTGVLRVLASW